MKEKDSEKRHNKLHYTGQDPLQKSNVTHSSHVKPGNDNLPDVEGSGKAPGPNTDRGNSMPDDTHTGRWQKTIIKREHPEQAQSPDVGADNNVEENYEKGPFDAKYGKNHANKGTRMSLGSGRGEEGLSSKLPSKTNKAMNQKMNGAGHQGDRSGRNDNA